MHFVLLYYEAVLKDCYIDSIDDKKNHKPVIILGYARLKEEEIRWGLARLNEIWDLSRDG